MGATLFFPWKHLPLFFSTPTADGTARYRTPGAAAPSPVGRGGSILAAFFTPLRIALK